jgi:ABC-type transport system involved in cytochrome c biogenesis permease component
MMTQPTPPSQTIRPSKLRSPSFFQFLKLHFKLLLRRPAFLLTTVSFGLVLIVILSFTLPYEILKQERGALGVLWVVFEFTCLLSLNQALQPEKEGSLFTLIFTSQMNKFYYLLSKIVLESFKISLLQIPLIVLWVLLYNIPEAFLGIFFKSIFSILVLFNVSSSALGILIQALMIKSHSRELLFPLLFFPLQVVLIMAAISLSFQGFLSETFEGSALSLNAWWSILIGYGFILFALLYVSSPVLLKEES